MPEVVLGREPTDGRPGASVVVVVVVVVVFGAGRDEAASTVC